MKNYLVYLIIIAAAYLSVQAEVDLSIVWQKKAQAGISFAKWSADGNFIYCAVGNNIQKMDAKSGEFISAFQNEDVLSITSMDISQQGNYIVTNNGDGAVNIWDTRIERATKKIQLGVASVVISPNEEYIIVGSARNKGKEIIIYDFINNKEILTIPFIHAPVALAFSHDGTKFASGTYYKDDFTGKYFNKLVLWETVTWKEITVLEDKEDEDNRPGYRLIKFSFDDKYLGGINNNYNGPFIYDLNTYTLVRSTDGRACISFDFLPDLSYYLVFHEWDSQYALEVSELITNKIINNYKYYATIIETKNVLDNKILIFDYGDTVTRLLETFPSYIPDSFNPKALPKFEVENGQIFIELNGESIAKSKILITDLLGKKVYEENIANDFIQNKILINVKLLNGFYICKIKNGTKEYSQKIEIVR